MPRHEFRTIEEFLEFVDGNANADRALCIRYADKPVRKAYYEGSAVAWEKVAEYLRNSNIGIVYPKSEPVAHRQEGSGFWECDECASKPGSPTLCRGCLHNRRVIDGIRRPGL